MVACLAALLTVASYRSHRRAAEWTLTRLREQVRLADALESLPEAAPLPGDPEKPTIPARWCAEINRTTLINGSSSPLFGTGMSSQASDSNLKRMWSRAGSVIPYAPIQFVGTPLEWLNSTTWATADGAYQVLSGAKYPGSSDGYPRFVDEFRMLKRAHYAGEAVFQGTAVHKWLVRSFFPGAGVVSTLLMSTIADGTPLFMEQNTSFKMPGSTSKVPIQESSVYVSWQADGECFGNTGAWEDFDPELFTNPPPCDADHIPPPTSMTSYIFHPKNEWNISAQDNGNAQGDVYFVCEDMLSNQSAYNGYQIISEYTIDYVPRFGQYQNCNGYPSTCFGNEHFWVGHEAALGQGSPSGGQCEDNPLTGEWYSLPVGGKCAAGAAPGDGSCTWTASRVKTIDAKCLFARGFIDACTAEMRAPFPNASKIFAAAFTSDDASAGGCPPLPGPPPEEARAY